ncbi:hypothetical protein SAMN02799627_02565 [Methylobacterium sp. 13MFTsu3.1M2]|nr:hypothetical protein SAMN02799627_02565 [Methylobacterium sp. 13MFTsu3.1M2]
MRYTDIVRAITEEAESGIIKPVAPSDIPKAGAYQTRQPTPKKRSRWQTPPAPAPKSKPPTS